MAFLVDRGVPLTTIENIKSRLHTEQLVEELLGVRPRGPDGQGRYLGLCPFHDDTTPSLRIFETGGFLCFACGAKGGDVIDFWARYATRGDVAEAIKQLATDGDTASRKIEPVRREKRPELPQAPTAVPIPEVGIPAVGVKLTFERPGATPGSITPSMVYAYRDRAGVALAAVVRAETAGGRKTFRPLRWDGERWWAVAQEAPRTIYGLEQIKLGQQVLIVEGEKACEAARRMAPASIVAVSWSGGGNAVGMTDWDELRGHRVVLWPDNDAPGRKAMGELGELLLGVAAEIKIIDPVGLPEKGDAADLEPLVVAGETSFVPWLRARVSAWTPPAAPEPQAPHEKSFAGPEAVIAARNDLFPFHILGQHENRAYFLKKNDGRVVSHLLTSLQRPEVLGTLADPDIWRKAFGGQSEDGTPVGWKVIGMAAQSHVMRAVESLPEFDPQLTRGRGCWPHGKGLAWNRGDLLVIDGVETRENHVDGKVYERGAPLPVDLSKRLSDAEGVRLIDVIGECNWADANASIMLAGWIALAPLCGALQWRPHVWITGPHGSGKSTVLDEIVKPAIGSRGYIRLAGNTSEAGLRQTINRDSLPVLLDETESESKSMKAIMDLSRSASTGDIIVRGSANQSGAHHYHIRSAFCFSAINTSIEKAADESRITKLFLVKRNGDAADERYMRMRESMADLMDAGFGARLSARMISMAPTVFETIRVMENAVTRKFGSRRLAQQYGALLAGAWCLRSAVPVTEREADGMADYVPESQQQVEVQEDDSARMLNHMLSFQVEIQSKSGRMKVAIGELVGTVASVLPPAGSEINKIEAEDLLGRWGMRLDLEGGAKVIAVAKRHPILAGTVFRDTAWSNSYADRFKDLPGAEQGNRRRYAGGRYLSVLVPIERFSDE